MPIDVNGYKITSNIAQSFASKDIFSKQLFVALDASIAESYPGSGTTWYDISGNNRHGTLVNSPGFTSTAGGALTFNASNTYVTLGNIGTIGNYQTIEIWFYSTSVTNYLNMCDMNYSTYGSTGNVGPRLEQNSNGTSNTGWVYGGNTSNNSIYNGQNTNYTIYANNWYSAVWTNNNGNVSYYLNNTLINTQTSPNGFITTFGDVNIGRGFSLAGNRYFNGYISMFKIYNKAMTSTEVGINWNVQKSRFGL
jgi:hypothetical protein